MIKYKEEESQQQGTRHGQSKYQLFVKLFDDDQGLLDEPYPEHTLPGTFTINELPQAMQQLLDISAADADSRD